MKSLLLILLMIFSSQAFANDSKACSGSHLYTDFKFSVMKKSYLGMIFGYGTNQPPYARDLVWTSPNTLDKSDYNYRAEKFGDFIKTLSPLHQAVGSKWNAMFASYKSDGHYCVLSVDMDVKKIQRNFGILALDDFVVYINGYPYYSLQNPYVFFYDGLDDLGYIDAAYH